MCFIFVAQINVMRPLYEANILCDCIINFHMRYYIKITLKYLYFRSIHDRFGFYLRRRRRNGCQKLTPKSDVMTSKMTCDVKKTDTLTSCTWVVFHPPCNTTFPSPGRVQGNSGRICKKGIAYSCFLLCFSMNYRAFSVKSKPIISLWNDFHCLWLLFSVLFY